MFTTAFLDLPHLASAHGCVQLPGSKSISNRVLLLAALSHGTTVLHDLLDSDDTRVMLQALHTLGCTITPGQVTPGQPLHITGLGGALPADAAATLFLGNAGTAMRPLTAALAVLGGQFEMTGIARMYERPIGDLVDALRQLGCQIDYLGTPGYPPLKIGHPDFAAHLAAPIRVRGDVSSQFLTSLLMALPLLAQEQAITIDVEGELISKPYIHITLELLARFGIRVKNHGWQRFVIPAGSRYQSPGAIHVEADASSASYFIALGAIATGDNGQKSIKIEGVGLDSIQGDIRFAEAAQAMGAVVTGGPNWLQVQRGAWPLKAIDLDCNHIPDAAMTLAAMALYANGTTTLRNIASWRVKETDRIAAMACELRKLGATVEEGADCIRITPPASVQDWQAASIHTYDDHRVAMCFSLAAFNPAGLPVRIEDPQCVAKTFPDYFEALFTLVQPSAPAPVICIDGPTASGKGTVASLVAQRLGFALLDSGALYRIAGLAATRAGIPLEAAHAQQIADLVATLHIVFTPDQRVLLGAEDTDPDSSSMRQDEPALAQGPYRLARGLTFYRSAADAAVQHGFQLRWRLVTVPGVAHDHTEMGRAAAAYLIGP